ncbi:MAG: DUF2730 family protein [Methylocystis sp.]
MTIDWGTAGQWAGVCAAIVIAVWGAMSKRNEKEIDGLSKALVDVKAGVDKDINELRSDRNKLFGRVDDIDIKLARVESDIEHLPTKDEMHELEMKVVGIDGKMDAMLDKIGTLIGQNARAEDRVIEAERRASDAERKTR